MARVFIIGYDPDTIDFTDPGPPAGLNPEKLWEGTAESLRLIEDHGWQADPCLVPPNETAVAQVEAELLAATYDCIVIGGGVRMAQKSVPVFEKILDAIRRVAPEVQSLSTPGPTIASKQRRGGSRTPVSGKAGTGTLRVPWRPPSLGTRSELVEVRGQPTRSVAPPSDA